MLSAIIPRSLSWKDELTAAIKADIAQLVERLTCNENVLRSIRGIGSNRVGFPSGQRDQTVNLTAKPSEVQILPPPP